MLRQSSTLFRLLNDVNVPVKQIQRAWISAICKDKEQMLYLTQLEFDSNDNDKQGKRFKIEAVYQDTLPSGSSLGTVVAIHGSPGSHKDWKYITPVLQKRGVRFIGVNFPGFGYSQDLPTLKHDNVERNNFVEALLDHLELRENIIFMGHSRGSENALKLSARNQSQTVGTVMLNSPGLRIHRGIRPFSAIQSINWTYEKIPFMRGPVHFFLHKFYNRIGLRLNSGRVAINSIATMLYTALGKQKPFLDVIAEKDHIRALYCYACNDFLIEPEISREFADEFKDRVHLVCKTRDAEEEAEANKLMKKAFIDDNRRSVTVEFQPDGHFLQKFRANFVADGIISILESVQKEKQKRL